MPSQSLAIYLLSLPFSPWFVMLFVSSASLSDIKVGIPECCAIESSLNPIVVHTECPHKKFLVILPQIFVEWVDSFGFELKKHWIDDLYYIVAFH